MDERERTDPALDIATGVILRAQCDNWAIPSEHLEQLRRRYGELSAEERTRCRAILTENLEQRLGVSEPEALRMIMEWFPESDPE